MTGVPIKGVIWPQRHRETAMRRCKAERLGYAPTSQGADSRSQKPGEGPGTNSPSSLASGGADLAITLILDFEPLELRQYASIAEATQLVVACSDSSGKLIHLLITLISCALLIPVTQTRRFMDPCTPASSSPLGSGLPRTMRMS